MARGSEAKAEITSRLLETFSGSFLYNNGKEVRIPYAENGELIQIKVTLTAAKVNVESGADTALPGATKTPEKTIDVIPIGKNVETNKTELTEEEKARVEKLILSRF